MEYFADVRAPGPIRHNATVHAISVIASPDQAERIGIAIQVGALEDGLAVWRLKIDGAQVPGLWAIMDRRFVSGAERLSAR